MSSLVLPRFLVVDTSTINQMADDFFSVELSKREAVKQTLKEIGKRNWLILLSIDHLFELTQHGNSDVAKKRIRFVKAQPCVAWINSASSEFRFGGSLEIDALECQVIATKGKLPHSEIVSIVRTGLFGFGTGRDLTGDNEGEWNAALNRIRERVPKTVVTASVLRARKVPSFDKMKLRDLLGRQVRTNNEFRARALELVPKMERELEQHGDERLVNAKQIARIFYERVSAMGSQYQNDNQVGGLKDLVRFVEGILGFPLSEEDLEMTVADAIDLSKFSKMLTVYHRNLRLSEPLTIKTVRPENCPTWTLRSEIRKIQNKAEHVDGSDFGDCFLGTLVLYADCCVVDKRTNEFLTQVKRKSSFNNLIKPFFKASHYSQIPNRLPN